MIKLKAPINWKGMILEAGTIVSLTRELEVKMIAAGTAELFIPDTQKTEQKAKSESQPDKKKTKKGDK